MLFVIIKIKKMKKNTLLLLTLTLIFSFLYSNSFSQCACCAGAGVGSSNGDYNNGVLTLNKKQWVIEAYGDYRTIKEGGAPEDDEKLLTSMFIGSAGVRYGLNQNVTLSALLPYVFLHTNTGNDNGFGDIDLMATIKLLSKNNLNIALQTGVELPTGVRKPSSFDNTTVIVGSGSYDPMAGLIVSKKWDKFSIQANTLFKKTTKGFNDNYYGSLSIQNLSCSYRLLGAANSCNMDSSKTSNKISLSIFGSYYGEWLDKIKEDDIVDENSGYYAGFFNLGTNLSIKKFSFPVTASLPIISNMNGIQNPPGFRIRFGVVRMF
jgi:Putative MetA-pathway of phenol degradation